MAELDLQPIKIAKMDASGNEFQKELESIKNEIQSTKQEIAKVSEDIIKAEQEISEVSEAIKQSSEGKNQERLWEEEKQLREEEKQLREKKKLLREKEMLLREEEKQLWEIRQLWTKEEQKIPTTLPPSLCDKYVERKFAKCSAVITEMNKHNCAFLGPKGTGKTTTLIQTCHTAIQLGLKAYYYDANYDDSDFKGLSDIDCYFFIDNAQNLRELCRDKITRILQLSKVCLAFSSVLVTSSGDHDLKCYIPFTKCFFFQPFSREEVSQYITVHCDGKEWNHYTTTPYVLNQCLLGGTDYYELVNSLVRFFLEQACSQRLIDYRDGLFASLLSFLMTCCVESKSLLVKCGFAYVDDNDKLQLVYDKRIFFNYLVSSAKENYELFARYSIGAAEELLFSYHCQSGQIVAKCMGTSCHTICGRSRQPNTLKITCSSFYQQSSWNPADIPNLVMDNHQCSLIKLAIKHVAIDFIIYSFQGANATKTLYLIQVSALKYSQRKSDKRLSAVTANASELDNESPYEFYKNLFGIQDSNIFYIYSSPTIPHNHNFSTQNEEQERVYFHELSRL